MGIAPNQQTATETTSHSLAAVEPSGPPLRQPPIPAGITPASWQALGSKAQGGDWWIPERNGLGEVIGHAIRGPDGQKWFESGGKRGLTLAFPLDNYAGTSADEPVFVVEGATDTAAGISIGLDIVGRPSATGGVKFLSELLKDRHVCVLGENDRGAGRTGAMGIARGIFAHVRSVRVIFPPQDIKDLRQWVLAGAVKGTVIDAALECETLTAADLNQEDKEVVRFEPVLMSQLIADHPVMPPAVVEGMFREGEVVNVIASPKLGKSWFIHGLLLCVGSGRPWLGRATTKSRVLLIDFELHKPTIAARIKWLMSSMRMEPEVLDAFEVWMVRGTGLNIEQISQCPELQCPGVYGVICIDALYRALPPGIEENSNEGMTKVYNLLDSIAAKTGAAIVVVHHASKGNQSERSVTDVGSGAGAQSRAADSHIVLRDHEEDNAVVVDASMRSFAKITPFAISRHGAGWELAPDLDPTKLRKSGRSSKTQQDKPDPGPKTRAWTPKEFAVEIIGVVPIIKDEVIERATKAGLGKGQAESLLKLAVTREEAFRHLAGYSSPHKFSCVRPDQLLETDRRVGDAVSVTTLPPSAASLGGVGGIDTPPSPPPTGRKRNGGGK